MRKVYFDHNATSPVHPEVRDAMLPFLGDKFGNPSSIHWAGKEVRPYVDEARKNVAALVKADLSEVFFTAGGSEGDNMAIKGVLFNYLKKGGHVITTAIEHPAVLKTCRYMERFGFDVTAVPVDKTGMVDPDDVRNAIRKDTRLVSVMLVNNETGNIYPVKEICRISHEHGILCHTDAVQAIGKVPVDVNDLEVDFLTASGHKFNAPKGIGFQYVRSGSDLLPLISGGHHEGGFRAGTENVPGIVAIGKACEIVSRKMEESRKSIGLLRNKLEKSILGNVPETVLNGHPEKRAYNTTNISFKYIEGEALLVMLDLNGIAVSTGSACSSESAEPSHVLTAMSLDPLCSRGAIRFSLGLGNTEEDVDYSLQVIQDHAIRLLKMSPFYKGR
jgi:cysteine desulfurase